jgi:thioredoxin reductase (NADPH)
MAQSQFIREQRHDKVYPTLDPFEIERVRQFGDPRSFTAGEPLWKAGKVAPGLVVILAGSSGGD